MNSSPADPSRRFGLGDIPGALLFILLFLFFEGYRFAVGNQSVFLPLIESLYHFPYLKQDFGVENRYYYHPFFNHALAWLNLFFSLPLLFAAVQAATLFLLFLSLRHLARLAGVSSAAFWLSVLLMFLWQQQGLDGNVLWTNRTECQYFAWPFVLTSVIGLLRARYFLCGLCAGFVFFLHFQMGLILIGLSGLCALLQKDDTFRPQRLILFSAGAAIFSIPTLIFFSNILLSGQVLVGSKFVEYYSFRAKHHMAWDMRLYLLFFSFSLFPFFAAKLLPSHRTAGGEAPSVLGRLGVLQSVMLILGTLQFADYYLGFGFLARLQVLRLMPLVYVTGLFFTACVLLELLQSPKFKLRALAVFLIFLAGPRFIAYQSLRENWIYFLLTLVALFFAWTGIGHHPLSLRRMVSYFALAFFARHAVLNAGGFTYEPPPLHYNQPQTPWQDVCRAARQMTGRDARFLHPPYRTGFVFYSKRISFVEFKYGANYAKAYREWDKRLMLAASGMRHEECRQKSCLALIKDYYNELDEAAVLKIAREYGVDYFVTESPRAYDFPLLYQNAEFKLYALSEYSKGAS